MSSRLQVERLANGSDVSKVNVRHHGSMLCGGDNLV